MGANRCARCPLFSFTLVFILGKSFRRDVDWDLVSRLVPSNGFSKTTSSSLCSSSLHQFPARSHRSPFPNLFPAVACVPRTFHSLSQSLVSIHRSCTRSFSPARVSASTSSLVNRRPSLQALRGLIKRPFVTQVHLTRAHQCARTCAYIRTHTSPRIARFRFSDRDVHTRCLFTFAERNSALQPAGKLKLIQSIQTADEFIGKLSWSLGTAEFNPNAPDLSTG